MNTGRITLLVEYEPDAPLPRQRERTKVLRAAKCSGEDTCEGAEPCFCKDCRRLACPR